MAHMFGARCSTELTGEVTHVVAAKVCDLRRRSPGYCRFKFCVIAFISVGPLKSIWQEREAGSILFG